jgi:hypothetical protein
VTVFSGGEYGKRSGLLMDSVIMTDNLATIRYSEIDRIIGDFPAMAERCLTCDVGAGGPITASSHRASAE